ncbi:MFS transporter, partial [Thermovirga sp.]|uniref:MFS transporter n=1 Tax=Thermovirga sp. TaxID=2699834 RepID=UPI0025DAD3FB
KGIIFATINCKILLCMEWGAALGSFGSLLFKFIMGNFAVMSFGNIYFLLALYLAHYGINDPRIIGWILGIYFAVSAISRPFVGIIVEKLSFRRSLVAASCICLASSAGMALFSHSAVFALLFRAMAGFGSSLFLVGLTTYQTLAVPERIRGSSFTLATAGTIAPLVMVLPLAEWFLRSGMYEIYIWLPVLAAAMCLAVAYSIGFSDEVSLSGGDWGSYKDVFKEPAIQVLFISVVIFAMTDAAIVSLAGLALEKGLLASAFISTQAFVGLLIRLFGFRLMDRLPRSRLAAPSFFITAVSLMGLTFVHSNLAFVLLGVIYGIGMGLGFPLHLSLIGDAAENRLRPKATSMVWFLMAGCYFLSPVITGYLARILSFTAAFRIISALIIFSAPFVHKLFKKHLPSKL